MQILFYDSLTPIAYTDLTLHQQALRGTEGTVIRIAQGLSDTFSVYVAQHNRLPSEDIESNGVHYISFETAHALSPDKVILVRAPKLAAKMVTLFPQAQHYLWLHNMPSRELHKQKAVLAQHRFTILAVSQFHQKAILRRLNGKWYQRLWEQKHLPINVEVMYNPIDDHLRPEPIAYNPNQLIFTSSVDKGLSEVITAFNALRKQYPDYKLLITNPDNKPLPCPLPQNARLLGALPKATLIQHIRESFCVFYPQTKRIETFGLVYAEANAVGTPVLAHDFGAAAEILNNDEQLVNAKKISAVINKISQWRVQRPNVSAKENLRLKHILPEWVQLLNR